MSYKRLKQIVKKNGFIYKLEERNDPSPLLRDENNNPLKAIAMYACYGAAYSPDRITAYEVFYVKVSKGGQIGDNIIEPGELFPSNESFGKGAWAFGGERKEEKSRKLYNELIEKNNQYDSIESSS